MATITAPNGVAARWAVLLDSGADECLFPTRLAALLRLDITSLPQALVAGIGSQSNITYYSQLKIDLGDGISFSAFSGFTPGMDAVRLGLLGQSDFFKAHNVEFRLNENIFTIEKV